VIPVEVTAAPWHYTTFPDAFDHWQTLIAGVLAFAAGVGTVVVAMRVIAATREQTRATFKQTETTVDLEQMRDRSEALAFHVMLEAAMARVLAEVAWARKTYPNILTQSQGASVPASAIRQCITKGAFSELRAACVRQGGPLTGKFLDLEREIDSFAAPYEDRLRHAGLREQLASIETMATVLRQKAFERFTGSVPHRD
jgi:hypothetical protein